MDLSLQHKTYGFFIEYGVMTRFDIITFFSAQHHYTQNTTPEQQSYQKHQ